MSKDLLLGRFGSSHGIKGWLRVYSYTDPIDNLLHYPNWKIYRKQLPQFLVLEQGKIMGTHLVVKLEGVDSPEQAKNLTNVDIFIARDDLPHTTTEELYWTDLIGLQVFDTHGTFLGVIDSLFPTGANDIIVVKNDEHEMLIPYIKSVIKHIELNNNRMIIDWEDIA